MNQPQLQLTKHEKNQKNSLQLNATFNPTNQFNYVTKMLQFLHCYIEYKLDLKQPQLQLTKHEEIREDTLQPNITFNPINVTQFNLIEYQKCCNFYIFCKEYKLNLIQPQLQLIKHEKIAKSTFQLDTTLNPTNQFNWENVNVVISTYLHRA